MNAQKETQLQVMIDSGLETTKAQIIFNEFQGFFNDAHNIELQAREIVVTDASQIPEMQDARKLRLFLKDKRIAIENTRKSLKEQALCEGKAIDGMANVLKGIIIPLERHLLTQEDFVKIKEAREAEERRIEGERLFKEKEEREAAEAEEVRLEQEEAARKEQAHTLKENEKLRKEAEEKEIARLAELKKQESRIAGERIKAQKEREEIKRENRIEKEKQDKILADERAKAQAEREAAEEKSKEMVAEQKERDRIQAEVDALARKVEIAEEKRVEEKQAEYERLEAKLALQITCPKCGHTFEKGE